LLTPKSDKKTMLNLQYIEQKLEPLHINKARKKAIAAFLIAIFAVQTVGLPHIANVFPTQAQKSSAYIRLRRLLQFDLDLDALTLFLATLCAVPPPWTLAIDRTNWKWGKAHINILMLCIVVEGISFPLLWTVLNKEEKEGKSLGKTGNSNTKERIQLFDRFISLFPEQKDTLLADREFASQEFCNWLELHGIFYGMRLRSDYLIADSNGEMSRGDYLFRNAFGKEQVLGWRKVLGKKRYVVGTRLETGDYLIVISNKEFRLEEYRLRWGIETMFGSFKSRGFHLEDTHVTDPARISCLVGLLSLAYTLAGACGNVIKPLVKLRPLNHGYAPICPLRLGLDVLQCWAFHHCRKVSQWQEEIVARILYCT
jgi:Transposase DDE domain